MHPTVTIFDPFRKEDVEIDQKLTIIIQKLWHMGYQTFACCQGGHKKGHYVMDVKDAAAIIEWEPRYQMVWDPDYDWYEPGYIMFGAGNGHWARSWLENQGLVILGVEHDFGVFNRAHDTVRFYFPEDKPDYTD